ncbi:melanocortin receptor 5-like [Thrips palmi]|uniref:Melanocortin receptor 5-like n=1 Tax=Thrips palmi TaxID=161013 RepID=A0A6P9A6M8_THRPL|nr:melanocortin receptor 5-like [Thrips palmi]
MPPTTAMHLVMDAAEPGRATVVSAALASALAPSTASFGTATPTQGSPLLHYNASRPTAGVVTLTVGGPRFEDYLPHIMVAFAGLEYVLMFLMLVCNIFVVAAYACSRFTSARKNSLRLSPAGRLVLNLAVADILVGLGLVYFSMPKFWPQVATMLARYYLPCVLRFSICFLTMFGSHCALLVVAMDRYAAIVHTLHYKDFMTTRTSWCLILVGWLVPIAGSSSIFFFNEWHPGVPSCDEHFIVPHFLIMFALPSNVFVLAAISFAHWRVHREIQAFTKRCNDPLFVASSTAARRSQLSCHKSARVLLRVTGTFILCWTPLDLMLVAFVVIGPHPVLLVAFEAAFALSMTSFLLNPLVYAWKTEAMHRPIVAALQSLRLLPRPGVDAVLAGGPPGALRRAGVFAITRNTSSVTSVSHSSCGTSSSAQTVQSSLSSATSP